MSSVVCVCAHTVAQTSSPLVPAHTEVRKAFTRRDKTQENGQNRNERLPLPPIFVAGTRSDLYCLAGSGLVADVIFNTHTPRPPLQLLTG